jgi:hypothetical protein
MRWIVLLLVFIGLNVNAQTFTYSGHIRNADGSGAVNFPVKVYKRTTPIITGFTSQTNYNGHSYYRSTGSMTWTDARQACVNMGGHLVTLANSAEQSFVFNTWPSGWIGFTDEAVEGQWRWVTGEPVTYTNWNSGEPNNAGNEDYAQFVSGGKWNDLPNVSLPYVIEFEYVVTTTAWVIDTIVYTNSSGFYSINRPTNPSIQRYIQYDAVTPVSGIQTTDIHDVANIILGKTIKKSIHFNMYDVNYDGNISVSDAYYISAKRYGNFMNWTGMPASSLITTTQYTTLINSFGDMRFSTLGVSSITINSPVSGGTANYYIIAPGYKGQVTY